MEYALHILVLIEVFGILAVSYNLIAGYTGLLSLSHAASFGIGAYVTATLALRYGMSLPVNAIAGMAIAAFCSLAVSLPAARLRGDYFMIATFGFQMIFFAVVNNWLEVTGGPVGLPGIPVPNFLGFLIDSPFAFAVFGGMQLAITCLIVSRVASRGFGRILFAIRADELFAQSLGKDTLWAKVVTYAIGSALAASAGTTYAYFITYIDPTSFTATESILILSMVVLGGMGSRIGPLVGAVILIVLPELFRMIGLPLDLAANLRQVFYGLILIALMALQTRHRSNRVHNG